MKSLSIAILILILPISCKKAEEVKENTGSGDLNQVTPEKLNGKWTIYKTISDTGEVQDITNGSRYMIFDMQKVSDKELQGKMTVVTDEPGKSNTLSAKVVGNTVQAFGDNKWNDLFTFTLIDNELRTLSLGSASTGYARK